MKVEIWGSLRGATGGQSHVDVKGETFKQILDALAHDYPGLRPQIKRGVSLAIDGTIFKESWFTPVKPDSEVILMPLMAGG